VPGARDTIAMKRLFAVCQIYVKYFPKTSLYSVPGFHDTIAVKHLCTVFLIFVTIFPLKRLCAVCQVCMRQLPSNVCLPCARFTWQYFPQRSLFAVPSLDDTVALKRLFSVCQIYITIFTLICLCTLCQYSPKTSVHRVAGLHDTIAVKPL